MRHKPNFSPIRGNLNWLAFYISVLVLPVAELADLLQNPHLLLPISEVIATMLVAIGTIAVFLFRRAPGPSARPWQLALIWCAGATVILIAAAWRDLGFHAVACHLPRYFSCFIPAVILGAILRAMSPKLDTLLGFLVSQLSFIYLGVWLDLMGDAVHTLHNVYDPVLYRLDALLGLSWTNIFTAWCQPNTLSERFLKFNYDTLSLFITAAVAYDTWRNPPERASLLLANVTLGYCGYLLYFVVPAIGPFCYFGALYPNHLPPAAALAAHAVIAPIATLRNAMPSLHAAAAMLIFLSLRDAPAILRAISALLVLTMFIATIGLGEHYAVDWLGAFAVTLMVRGTTTPWLAPGHTARRDAVLLGAGLMGLWLFAIRFAPGSLDHPWAIRALALATVIVPIAAERRLAAAAACETASRFATTSFHGPPPHRPQPARR